MEHWGSKPQWRSDRPSPEEVLATTNPFKLFNLKSDLEKSKSELEKSKKELENCNRNLEKSKSELEKSKIELEGSKIELSSCEKILEANVRSSQNAYNRTRRAGASAARSSQVAAEEVEWRRRVLHQYIERIKELELKLARRPGNNIGRPRSAPLFKPRRSGQQDKVQAFTRRKAMEDTARRLAHEKELQQAKEWEQEQEQEQAQEQAQAQEQEQGPERNILVEDYSASLNSLWQEGGSSGAAKRTKKKTNNKSKRIRKRK